MGGGPGPDDAEGALVVASRVRRRFGASLAVDDASLRLSTGRIHAVVGENGAGKSTLLKLVAGALRPDAGEVRVGGARLAPHDLREATRRGVSLVHQHFMLVPSLDVLDNLALGAEPTSGPLGLLDRPALAARARALMEELGLPVALDAVTGSLGVGDRQRVEILRVLLRGARAVLLDEPTAILAPSEVERLYSVLRGLAEQGRAVAVVTHRPSEVSRFCDRVTVMRRGRVVAERDVPDEARAGEGREAFEAALVRDVMGRSPPPPARPAPVGADAPVRLVVRDVPTAGGRLSLEARRGEIVGIAGIEGSGQVELVRALAGLDPEGAEARVEIDGAPLPRTRDETARVRARRGFVGVVHGDRHREGLLLEATVHDNLVLGELSGAPVLRAWRGSPGEAEERARVAERVARYGVVPDDPELLAGALSGGNQQKVVVGRALGRVRAAPSPVLVLHHPTRGIDVGAQAAVRAAVVEAAAAGAAVIVASSDLDELRALAHRVVVLEGGRVAGTLPPDASDEEIGRLLLGAAGATA